MITFCVFLLTFLLICTSAFVILVILMQRPSSNAGFGSALGGGAATSVFGSETSKVLTKWTIYGIVVFFIASLLLSMLYVVRNKRSHSLDAALPVISDTIKR